MHTDATIIAVIATFAVSLIAFWSNPQRPANRVFFSSSIHVALWLLSLRAAFLAKDASGLFWLRTASAIGAGLPWHIWLIKEVIRAPERKFIERLRSSLPWAALTIGLCLLPDSHWFIPAHSTSANPVYGLGYYGYTVGIVFVYLLLCREAVLQMRVLTGLRRLELQILMVGGSATALTIMLLMGLRALLALPWLVRLQPIAILIFYSTTVIAITTHRVFNARQLFIVGFQKSALIVCVATFAFGLDALLNTVLQANVFAFLVTTALTLWFAAFFNSWLNRRFQFYPQATSVRQAAFDAARRETKFENLEIAFKNILKGWGQSDLALMLSGEKDELRGGGIQLPLDSPIIRTMRQLRWVTPERLSSERTTSDRVMLASFLQQQSLGVLVIGEGPTLTTFVGVGVPASRRPFTYPQVTQLQELASIFENALERAHFSIKAQHSEQLATVGLLGASLAHEIRNPLVSIKTFVQHLPQHYHDPAFRDKFFKLIGSEVQRIDQLTEQLLDLASPRAYMPEVTELHPMLHSTLELVAAKAADKRVDVREDLQAEPDQIFTDTSATKQVVLNLCFNAIQAVELHSGERWVKISTRNVESGVEMAVEDSGPGIAPEIRPKLFQPFQSTKSTGFGLGLAICGNILTSLNATITVDPTVQGRGATFRIIFPCQAS